MRFRTLAEVYEQLEAESGRLEKIRILSEFFSEKREGDLKFLVQMSSGGPFAAWEDRELGVAHQLVVQALSVSSGWGKEEIVNEWRARGDLGLVAEESRRTGTQQTLFSASLHVSEVKTLLHQFPNWIGPGSQDRKVKALAQMLGKSDPLEARYLVRMVLGELRMGVGEGVVRDALVLAFSVEKTALERGIALTNDLGELALISRDEGTKALQKISLRLFRPMKAMLAQKVDTVEEGLEKLQDEQGRIVAEYKYDGIRLQIHVDGGVVRLFTRRLEDVTKQFPEAVMAVSERFPKGTYIFEAEASSYTKSGSPLPFQALSRRIKRKYDIEAFSREMPVVLQVFDLLYAGTSLLSIPLRERWERLVKLFSFQDKTVTLATHLETDSSEEIHAFYQKALRAGQEGLMLKNLDSTYRAGSRVGSMVKLKPLLETLDLVIIGAEWGEGKRSAWLSSFLLACRHEDTYVSVGRLSTGFTDEEFKQITADLKRHILSEEGRSVVLEPFIIVEVGYEEIQKSSGYESGFALRFPRLVSIRLDKSLSDVSTISQVKLIFAGQKGK